MSSRRRLLFYCQHSLGLGHLVRSLALAAALAEDFRVVLLSGGRMPAGITAPAGVELVSLPPLSMDTDGALSTGGGRGSVEHVQRLRRQQILRAHDALRPDVVLVELFPFGRRRFAGELIPLLEAARAAGAAVACSLRDILVSQRRDQAAHDEQASTLANTWLDAVLVHADPRFARLEESFAPRTPLRVPVHYTGFVCPPADPPPRPQRRARRIVVSAGGGAYAGELLTTAVDAHRLALADRDIEMRVLAGPFVPDAQWRALRAAARARPGLEMHRSVPDLCAELTTAAGSVSQCGYNTALDIVRAGVPALVVPFAEGREDEQANRAERLERLGLVRVLQPSRMDAPSLAEALLALPRFNPASADLDLDGGRASARILTALAARPAGKQTEAAA